MSLAYRCDLCGEFVMSENDAQAERTVASENATISNTVTLLSLNLNLGQNHVCDDCFNIGLQKTKAWVQAHL